MEGRQHIRSLTRYEKTLLLLFLFSLPLVNPWVRGDGVGYYAYARALVVQGNLRFEPDWLHANSSFLANRAKADGQILPGEYTATGHLNNHFSIGPALDWMPFLQVTHAAVRVFDSFGGKIAADGFSWPYTYTMALVTALAGFSGLLFSFSVARKYFPERWAFLATLGIWLASSLPVYMYFNPSWSHAHSAFAVALFIWYWERTRGARTIKQWVLLGLTGALMVNMYYLNAIFLLAPLLESLWRVKQVLSETRGGYEGRWWKLLVTETLFVGVVLVGLLPTFATRWIIYGSPLVSGYTSLQSWNWTSPVFAKLLFSSDHGLFAWTPILVLATLGLIFLPRRDRQAGIVLLVCVLVFYVVVSCYPDWDGISSFGNRFFVSLTPIFVIGLTALFAKFGGVWQTGRGTLIPACVVTGFLIVWNLGLIFQWGMHLIPDRGTFYWSQMIDNQFRVVPAEMAGSLKLYFMRRGEMMQAIERRDLRQLHDQESRQEKGGS